MELKKKLGKRIQELRVKRGLKQSELAEKVGIATKHQSCIETGKNYPSAELVEKYAKALNIETEELLVISHVKPIYQMKEEIINCIKTASNEQTILAYKIFNGIFN